MVKYFCHFHFHGHEHTHYVVLNLNILSSLDNNLVYLAMGSRTQWKGCKALNSKPEGRRFESRFKVSDRMIVILHCDNRNIITYFNHPFHNKSVGYISSEFIKGDERKR
uniref:Uncharacterized protein n=1 Tax=Cacopsylla melanoneura TaxID=428564 RepID=A0A8D8WKR5_9HEMI